MTESTSGRIKFCSGTGSGDDDYVPKGQSVKLYLRKILCFDDQEIAIGLEGSWELATSLVIWGLLLSDL